ncbi:uncharacterized protein [Drosophila bipectinata]|uniref:uncharacterized protein isoform X2 n=1 Tax=Drosophila bipectinata TaxID=42026 RepID=UPI0038B313A5
MVMKSTGTQTDKKVGKKSAERGHVNLPTDPIEHNAVSEVEEQSAKTGPVYSCGFEVFGIVQGVSFRMNF